MKKWIHEKEDILCMSDVRGIKVKVESKLPFSFYYSARNSSHGPRVKITSDPTKIRLDRMGSLELTGDWDYISTKGNDEFSSKELKEIRAFFRKYLILFLLVWDKLTSNEPSLGDYLEGDITLAEFIQDLDFYDDYKDDLDQIENVEELEEFCRKYKLVNFYGN